MFTQFGFNVTLKSGTKRAVQIWDYDRMIALGRAWELFPDALEIL